MNGTAIDSQLIEITSGPPPATIADVLTLMQKIDSHGTAHLQFLAAWPTSAWLTARELAESVNTTPLRSNYICWRQLSAKASS